MPSRKKDNLHVLFILLCWLGINISTEREGLKICKFLYPILAHLAIIDVIAIYIVHFSFTFEDFKLNLAHATLYIISLALWYAMYKRRESLKEIFPALMKISKTSSLSGCKYYILHIALSLNFLFIIIFGSILIYFMNRTEDANFFCSLMSYHIWEVCEPTEVGRIYIFVQNLLLTILSPLFSNVVAILYTCLCYRCSLLLSRYRSRIEMIISQEKYCTVTPKLGRMYLDIAKVIDEVQNVFSLPALFSYIITFMQSFIVFVRLLLNAKEGQSYLLISEHLCLHIPSCIFTLLIPFYATQVAIEMKKITNLFHRLYENMTLKSHICTTENLFIGEILKKSIPVTLSAWEMIEFSDNIVLTAVGTFLTYALLILNIEKAQKSVN